MGFSLFLGSNSTVSKWKTAGVSCVPVPLANFSNPGKVWLKMLGGGGYSSAHAAPVMGNGKDGQKKTIGWEGTFNRKGSWMEPKNALCKRSVLYSRGPPPQWMKSSTSGKKAHINPSVSERKHKSHSK